MKLKGPWQAAAPTQAVFTVLEHAGHNAYFVGGCVRNALLDHPVSDIDISTDALPDEVMTLAEDAGLRVAPTGIDHGTVTVVSGDIPHEITTFRKDVATDGRRATVAFSKDIRDDALRRDFTMNALYAKADGTVVDPLGGLADLKARRLRFIEDAETRIREDYLRILRFFRFQAWFGAAGSLDPDSLAACAALADGISRLSKERIGAEMCKLLAAPDPAPAIAAMRASGVLMQVLPGADDQFVAPLVHLEGDAPPSYLRRLAILGGADVAGNLRLSKTDARTLGILREEMGALTSAKELGYRHGVEIGLDVLLLRAAMAQISPAQADIDDLEKGAAAIFPLTAADLMPAFEGPALGQKLKQLEQAWLISGCQMNKEELLSIDS